MPPPFRLSASARPQVASAPPFSPTVPFQLPDASSFPSFPSPPSASSSGSSRPSRPGPPNFLLPGSDPNMATSTSSPLLSNRGAAETVGIIFGIAVAVGALGGFLYWLFYAASERCRQLERRRHAEQEEPLTPANLRNRRHNGDTERDQRNSWEAAAAIIREQRAERRRQRREDGLNSHGEAPPPYQKDDPDPPPTINEAIELQPLPAVPPPDYATLPRPWSWPIIASELHDQSASASSSRPPSPVTAHASSSCSSMTLPRPPPRALSLRPLPASSAHLTTLTTAPASWRGRSTHTLFRSRPSSTVHLTTLTCPPPASWRDRSTHTPFRRRPVSAPSLRRRPVSAPTLRRPATPATAAAAGRQAEDTAPPPPNTPRDAATTTTAGRAWERTRAWLAEQNAMGWGAPWGAAGFYGGGVPWHV